MRRPNRSIETFDISLMAVVTKAMGAFLVMMLLLLPYYSSSPLGKDEAQDLAKKVRDADAKIQNVLGRLGDSELRADLSAARDQLGSGQQLVNQLKRYVDQLSSQVGRLEERLKTVAAELEQLKRENARLAPLEAESRRLREENARLKEELERLKQQIAQLQLSTPERVAELQQRIRELEAEIARLRQENASLRSQVADLQSQAEQLRQRVAQLEQVNAALYATAARVAPLEQENRELKRENADLQAKLKRYPVLTGTVVSDNCGETLVFGAYTSRTVVNASGQKGKSVLDHAGGIGNRSNPLPIRHPTSSAATGHVSTFVIRSDVPNPNRYILVLTNRRPSKSQNPGGLQARATDCRATILASYVVSDRTYNVWWQDRTMRAGSAVEYVGDALIDAGDAMTLVAPSPEGQQWVDDQIAHSAILPPDAPNDTPPPKPQP